MSSTVWGLRSRRLSNEHHTLVMGVLNVTPDSFSDGGDFLAAADAVAHGRRMAVQGADIIDVGGESTRPGSSGVTVEEETARVVPVVRALADEGLVVSIDTSKAAVAEAALAAGAEIVNDVSALSDARMAEVVADHRAGLVLMHMRGTPATMQADPHYRDVTAEVRDWLLDRAARAEAAGVDHSHLCLDPGIGFGKTADHNLTLLRDLASFTESGYPVLLGASRKSFIGRATGLSEPRARDAATAGITALAVAAGVFAVRVHDVPGNVQSARIADAIVRGRMFDEVGG